MELIEKQQAIDAVTDELDMIDHVPQWVFDRLEKRLKQLPPIQPEIIRCKDCKHSEYDAMYGDRYCHFNGKAEIVPDTHYCGYSERRTDG
jgi:hypothetical protein